MERLNNFEKKQMKGFIIKKGFGDRKMQSAWKKHASVVAVAVIIGIPAFGFTFPALAQHIPIIGGMFTREELLQEFASEVDVTVESDGVAITINEAVFVGDAAYFTLTVEADRDLGDVLVMDPATNLFIEVDDEIFKGASYERTEFTRLDGYTYTATFSTTTFMDTNFKDVQFVTELIRNAGQIEVALSIGALLNDEEISLESRIERGIDHLPINPVAEGPWYLRFSIENILGQ